MSDTERFARLEEFKEGAKGQLSAQWSAITEIRNCIKGVEKKQWASMGTHGAETATLAAVLAKLFGVI